tara:strand:- start:34 stop:2196 length:2163 start_codon:yes stop_codon:yes gene_type:complete
MEKEYIKINGISVASKLADFVKNELLENTEIDVKHFWNGFEKSINKLVPINKELLKKRQQIQKKIDDWHNRNKFEEFDSLKYKKFLNEIGYIVNQKEDFKIETTNVDIEISKIAGPQLVVPVMNARYALNAANARWGSLYDALYGSDYLDSNKNLGSHYNPFRGGKVIKYCREFLDKFFPLTTNSWKKLELIDVINNKPEFIVNGKKINLKNPDQYVGYRRSENKLKGILFKNNNLHVELVINPYAFTARQDPSGISDLVIESAITTIMDHEDSVSAVNSEDKILGYRNWLGLMKGNLKITFDKSGKVFERKLNTDRKYIGPQGEKIVLHGRSLLLNRNVGHLMTNSSIILADNSEIPEGIMDAFFTSAACLHDLKKRGNSRTGSIYIVKPKMHGPEEVAFTNEIFNEVENVLKLKSNTIKVGIMDEERRTSVNLKECIRQVKKRVVFINTGFLDRTGDEMHTSMCAGPMIKKGDMKSSKWIAAYENNNVDVGLKCGFSGLAQIGKGMWPAPDKMADMMKQKIDHLKAGANCAWTPSPTAATLHSLHYHDVDVFKIQDKLKNRNNNNLENLLKIPIADRPNWSMDEIIKELENNSQGILGYVVRWIDQGIGCSKVPDINNVGLMEDRATLRISSQHIANWLKYNICTKIQVIDIMKKMARIVDDQNKNDKNYIRMSDDFENSIAFKTACDLVFKGTEQPSGYTEPLLHLNRLHKKSLNIN